MIKNLFNEKLNNGYKISISMNEIYYQFLQYMFFSLNKSLVIVTPTLTEANNIYAALNNRLKNTYIFPDDDYLTKHAIAISPELTLMRMKFLNNINQNEKCILICHTNSILKKLPPFQEFKNKNIKIKVGDEFSRDKLINMLEDIGYKRESMVTNTGEYSVRGFVVDIFSIFQEHPIRIEFFDNEIEKIKYFNEVTQISYEEINEFVIKPIFDDFKNSDSSVLDYVSDAVLVYQDFNQIKNVEDSIKTQMKYYDDSTSMLTLDNLKSNETYYIDTIDNKDNYNLIIKASSIENFNGDVEKFKCLLKEKNAFLCSIDDDFVKKFTINKDKIILEDITSGFIYNEMYYLSKGDLYQLPRKIKYDTGYKLGKRIDSIDKLEVGDYVVHKKHGIGIYMGINTISKNGVMRDYILIKYKGDDKLYLSLDNLDKLYKYSSKDGTKPTIYRLNSVEWQKTKMKIRQKVRDISGELINIYKNRSNSYVESFLPDTPEQTIFENEFIFEETPDQIRCTEEIKKDLESNKPMDRLLCGDVGYGKTEVIFRAMFKTVMNSKQVMYLCPTTLLSYQQFTAARERFINFPVNIVVLNRYSTKKEVDSTLEGLADGTIDIVFGTHRLLSGDVIFKDLGLLVIDEEQRFGVMHKEKIKKIKSNVHVLSVSATPIPRSLQMSLIGVRDLSLIETPPKNKLPVQTYVINYDPYILREVVLKEKARNGQVFILYNKVEDMESIVNKFRNLIPEVSMCYAHGKMNKEQMQDIMYEFTEGNYDVLISTTIIENGIDIPNANTIVVMNADRFGLSQLYQIRGRVGRSDRQAYAYLMYDKSKVLTETAVKRLDAIKEFTSLGSGYKIAMRDLSIRGAGDLLGSEQAGFIDSVGVDMYLELINEELSGKNISEDDVKEEVKIDDVNNHIGKEFTDEDAISIMIHQKIIGINTYEELEKVKEEIKDIFGNFTDDMEIYMYQELTEKMISRLNIKLLINDSHKFSFSLNEEVYNHLNIERLFIESTKINTKFNFVYRGNSIIITLNKNGLEKHYIYYIFKILEYIENNRNM